MLNAAIFGTLLWLWTPGTRALQAQAA
jgi:hypothetical protein